MCKWKQEVVSLTIKTLVINAFFGWRMCQRQDVLESWQTFQSLDNYWNLLNKVQATSDFMSDVAEELLRYGITLVVEGRGNRGVEGAEEIVGGEGGSEDIDRFGSGLEK